VQTEAASAASAAPWRDQVRDAVRSIRATVLAGIWLGALVGGVGGRLAMFVLRLTSSDHVHGVISDDGFRIGRVTLGGTYGLLGVASAIGIIGAASYRWVAAWLLGPPLFRRLTAAAGAGVVVGSMLVHADGVDFTLLDPQWLAIAFFVVLPATFAFFVGPLEAVLEREDAWVNRSWRGWALTAISVVAFPPNIIFVAVVTVVSALWMFAIRDTDAYAELRANRGFGLLVRGGWGAVALAGLTGLVSDVQAIFG
jgi:hypothetical protein